MTWRRHILISGHGPVISKVDRYLSHVLAVVSGFFRRRPPEQGSVSQLRLGHTPRRVEAPGPLAQVVRAHP